MKMKRLFTLAVLLTSSLAGAVDGVADSEEKYYAGLNFGAGWGEEKFKMKPSIVFGYHHDKNSKFELEALTNISNITDKASRRIGANLLANYRYYPDLDIDPVKLYVSGGLGGYVQIIEETKSFSQTAQALGAMVGEDTLAGRAIGKTNELASGLVSKVDVVKNVAEKVDSAVVQVVEKAGEIIGTEPEPSLVDKILGHISYKVKVGVDYAITPQIIGTAGITAGGQLSGLKALEIPDTVLEVGIRYNF